MAERANEKNRSLAALTPPSPDRSAGFTGAPDDDGTGAGASARLNDGIPDPAGPARWTPGAAPEADQGGFATSRFIPGYVFAGRYRIIAPIGRGGMGEVWRADDLVLQTPVALKLIFSTTAHGRERILNEVRLARRITHPAVCRVFDVAQAEGRVFYSMELVHGEDLATLLRRVGRLPAEKVVEVGLQLCAGLAAAHAQGVLHRDLKPANVLIDEHGSVRITDFGIAISTDDTGDHPLIGTPGYMSPEQMTPGAPLSERSDVYAVGVVLYELLVGVRPVPGSPVFGSDVSSELGLVILEALATDPRDRHESPASMAQRLLTASPHRRRRHVWPWLAAAAVAAIAGVIAVLSSTFLAPRGRPLTDQDTIVVADFVNTTGEPVFDGALKVALAVALEQSPFLRVFSDDRVRETLRLMERAPDEPVTRNVARELAQREQLKALVAGSIGRLGSHYVLALEAIGAANGDVMAREQVEVAAKEEVLTSLGAATSRLREKLGESLVSIERFDAPLPRATTASLDALHAYALALDQGRMVPRVEAIPYLERAIQLDPNFALALALLSGVYANTGRSAEAPAFAGKAFELRDRVSERERFFISWRYYLDATQAWDKALELAQSWTTTYPREAFAFNSMGIASGAFGRHDRAVDALREAIHLDPRFVPPYANLAGSLIALNRFAEAQTLIHDANAAGLDSIGLRRTAYLLALLENDPAAMDRALTSARGTTAAVWTSSWEARASLFSGRFGTAHELFRRSADEAIRDDLREVGAQLTMENAEAYAIAGQCGEAQREVARGLELGRDNFTLERAARALALCDAGSQSSALTRELGSRFSNATLTTRIQLPVAGAALAVRRGDSSRALELLDPVAPYDHAPSAEFWPPYLRGLAYLQLKNGPAASVQFEGILSHRGEAPASPLYPLAHLGAARAAVLTGDLTKARRSYEQLFSFWKSADSTLQIMSEARGEYARIQ